MALNDLDQAQKNKLSGVGGTIIFHALLMVFLLLTNLTTKVPYPDPGGIEVAMGDPEEGGPSNLPAGNVEENTSIPKMNSAPEEDMTTTEDPDVEATEKKIEDKKNDAINKSDKPVSTDNQNKIDGKNTSGEKPKKPNPFQMTEKSGEGTGKGDKPGSGGGWDGRGKDPNGTHGDGDKPGPGGEGKDPDGLAIAGRKVVKRPAFKSDVDEEEKVGVKITVDASGKVTAAKAGFNKSTTTDKKRWKEAEEIALQIRYNERADGKTVSETIVIRFLPQ